MKPEGDSGLGRPGTSRIRFSRSQIRLTENVGAPVAPRFAFLRGLTRRFDVTFKRRRSVRELRGLDDGAPLALSDHQSKRESTLSARKGSARKESQILVKRV